MGGVYRAQPADDLDHLRLSLRGIRRNISFIAASSAYTFLNTISFAGTVVAVSRKRAKRKPKHFGIARGGHHCGVAYCHCARSELPIRELMTPARPRRAGRESSDSFARLPISSYAKRFGIIHASEGGIATEPEQRRSVNRLQQRRGLLSFPGQGLPECARISSRFSHAGGGRMREYSASTSISLLVWE